MIYYRYIFQNKLNKACFQHDMTCENFKDLPRRTVSDNVLVHKAFTIARNSKCDKYQHEVALMVYTFFDKMSADGAIESEILSNQHPPESGMWQLAE